MRVTSLMGGTGSWAVRGHTTHCTFSQRNRQPERLPSSPLTWQDSQAAVNGEAVRTRNVVLFLGWDVCKRKATAHGVCLLRWVADQSYFTVFAKNSSAETSSAMIWSSGLPEASWATKASTPLTTAGRSRICRYQPDTKSRRYSSLPKTMDATSARVAPLANAAWKKVRASASTWRPSAS